MKFLKGTGVAMITPFDHNDSIDYKAIPKIVEHLVLGGADYIVLLGTTSESPTLNRKEKEEVIKLIIETNNNRIPLVIGIGGNNTELIKEEIKTVNNLNFSAVLSVCPYYNKPNQRGIYRHYEELVKVSKHPIMIYNVPSRTGVNIDSETIIKLAKNFKSIVAIKEASGNFSMALDLLKNAPKDFHVISGDDLLALPMVLAGGSGVISVLAGGPTAEFKKMIDFGLKGDSEKSYKIFYKLLPLIKLIFKEGNPSGIKCLSSLMNLCKNKLRLPLVEVSNNLKLSIKKEFDVLSH